MPWIVLRSIVSALASVGSLALVMPLLGEPLPHRTLTLVFAMNALALCASEVFFAWRARRVDR